MFAQPSPRILGRRYILSDVLGHGGMGIVYRAIDRLSGQAVALKQVTRDTEELTFASRVSDSIDPKLSLAQEFQTLASLRHPNIISVLDYGFDDESLPYFTMTLLENHQSFLRAASALDLPGKIDLLVQILQALAYLHRRGILHHDMKPSNVAVIEKQVKVLDFGLAVTNTRAKMQSGSTPFGTLAYMSPELLEEEAASSASDLYAVGVMAYELFAGHHPFETGNITKMLTEIISKTPDFQINGLPPPLTFVLAKLMAKDPAERFQTAEETIENLCSAIEKEPPSESVAIRESYLQAARFVGRKPELSQLIDGLNKTLKGTGGTWLVGGESGVGKSRLIDELRALALIRGALVLRGQAVSEGGSPYQLWRDALRWLALLVDLSDHEAGVLKAIIPDIGTLLGRDIPTAPELDPRATQNRLLSVIENLFQRYQHPTVIILEDIHWATESLDVLVRLSHLVDGLPLMIIASYRDDEKPNLPKSIPNATVLKLNRLDEQNIAELSESMLGAAGKQETVLKLLIRETEGNVFFLVEVVRALAEEVGQLENIGKATLPKNVFAGGVKRIVERRLNRVPDQHRPLLEIAAVAGRQIDVNVLHAVDSTTNIERWLADCASVAVLDVQDGRWQFAHDKLREGLLGNLSADQKRTLNRRVAQGIETAYPNAPQYAAVLALHWGIAESSEKEAVYTALAGEQSLRNGANQDAIRFLSRALILDKKLHSDLTSVEARLRRARIVGQLGQAYNFIGSLAEGLTHLRECLRVLQQPAPESMARVVGSLLAEIGRQFIHRLAPPIFVGHKKDQRDVLLEAARIYDITSILLYTSDRAVETLHCIVSGLNRAESAGLSPELAVNYSAMATACGIIPFHAGSRDYARRSLNVAQKIDDSYALSRSLSNLGVYYLGIASWHEAEPAFSKANTLLNQLGYDRRADECLGFLANQYYYLGQFEKSLASFETVYRNARRRGDSQLTILGTAGVTENLISLGRPREVITMVEAMKPEELDSMDALTVFIPLAAAYFAEGNYKRARETADRTLDTILKANVAVIYRFTAYTMLIQTYFDLLEMDTTAPDSALLPAQQVARRLSKFAGTFPVGKARAHLYNGLSAWMSQKYERAHKLWNAGLVYAEKLNMPYDKALLYYEMGRHLDVSDPRRKPYLAQACEIFNQLGAMVDLHKTEAASR